LAEGRLRKLTAVIVEDEERARRTLRALLDADDEIELVGEAAEGREAVTLLESMRPDIAFVDVQMPGMDGLAVLDQLDPDAAPVTVFVTAFDQYALDAFDIAAADYLTKPFSDARFRTALSRAKERARAADLQRSEIALSRALQAVGDLVSNTGNAFDRVILRDAGRTILVDPGQIDWVQAEGVYVRVHTGKRNAVFRRSLAEMERRLAPHNFFRIHRSTLVNLARVVQLRHASHGDYSVILHDGTELTLARTRRPAFEAHLGEPLG
jgi:two-component system, LytTR family, response regulator